MKRNIIYTAACLVAFASCQKQEVAEAPSQVEVAVELSASAAADATKTVMTEYNAHWWSVSDKISLFYTVEGKKVTVCSHPRISYRLPLQSSPAASLFLQKTRI